MLRLDAPLPQALRLAALGFLATAALGCRTPPQPIAETENAQALAEQTTAAVGPIAMFDRQSADFGTVATRRQSFEPFLAFNLGDRPLLLGPLTIRAEESCGAPAHVVDEVLYLPPMTGQVVRVVFGQHISNGPHRYSLGVPSNDPARPYSSLLISFGVDDHAQMVATGAKRLQ